MAGRSRHTIYVGNLPLDVKEWEIEDLFYKVCDLQTLFCIFIIIKQKKETRTLYAGFKVTDILV